MSSTSRPKPERERRAWCCSTASRHRARRWVRPPERSERALGEPATVRHVGVFGRHAGVEPGVVEHGRAQQHLAIDLRTALPRRVARRSGTGARNGVPSVRPPHPWLRAGRPGSRVPRRSRRARRRAPRYRWTHVLSRTGSVFSWFRKGDSTTVGLPASSIAGKRASVSSSRIFSSSRASAVPRQKCRPPAPNAWCSSGCGARRSGPGPRSASRRGSTRRTT